MSLFGQGGEKRRLQDLQIPDQEAIGTLCRLGSRPSSPKSQMEQEKRIRREIANSNERRRMQSINAGFQSLRTLLPHHEGEKLSKAAILQQTAEFIYQLEQEKTKLLAQNNSLKRVALNQGQDLEQLDIAPSAKRKKTEIAMTVMIPAVSSSPLSGTVFSHSSGSGSQTESSDEGLGNMSPEPGPNGAGSSGIVDMSSEESLRRDIIELRRQVDRERKQRMHVEDQLRTIEAQMYPERLREITEQVQIHYEQEESDSHYIHKHSRVLVKAEKENTVPVVLVPANRSPKSVSPPVQHHRLSPSVITEPRVVTSSLLEAVLKAEPKVEVELEPRVPSPAAHVVTCNDETTPDNVYVANTSRQNLDTIVEAIRHLEGDHMFEDDDPRPVSSPISLQDAPLALTTTNHNIPITITPMTLDYRHMTTHAHQILTRPGVIVVKHS